MCKKSHRHSWKRLTEAIYTEVSAKIEAAKVTGRRVSVSGMLKFLGMSRSGYESFLNRKVSPSCRRKAAVKKEIQKIYDNSKQNYGAPKISQELRKSGETILLCHEFITLVCCSLLEFLHHFLHHFRIKLHHFTVLFHFSKKIREAA